MSDASSGTLAGVAGTTWSDRLHHLRARYAVPTRLTAGAIALWALVLAALTFISQNSIELTLDRLTRDVAGLAGIHPVSGALSTFGLTLWAMALGALVAAWLAGGARLEPSRRRLVITSVALTTFLLLDDAFQFHEALGTRYLGIPEIYLIAAWPVLGLAWLVLNRRALLDTELLLLFAAFLLFATSLVIDVLMVPETERSIFVEDGFKFGGILFWALYALRLSASVLGERRRTDEIRRSA